MKISTFAPYKKANQKIYPRSLTFLVLCTSFAVALLSPPAKADRLRVNRFHRVTGGPVYLQRRNRRRYSRPSLNTELNSEDFLYVPAGTSVQLLCNDGNTRRWTSTDPDNVGSICPGQPRIYRDTGATAQWGASDAAQAYVIGPRTGQVMTATPTLSWNAVEGAQQYEVTLQKRAGNRWEPLWTTTSISTVLCYPNDQPALEPGKEYTVQVSVADEPDSAEILAERPVFSLVGEDEQQAIESAIANIQELETDPVTETVILTQEVYPQYKLFARGMRELSALVASGQATAQVHRLLGDYAARTGLALPAEENYLAAIALAGSTEELEEQTLATFALGKTYRSIGQPNKAQTYLQQAEQLAESLGDDDLVASILDLLEDVQPDEDS